MGHGKVNSKVQRSLVAGDWKGKGAERWRDFWSHAQQNCKSDCKVSGTKLTDTNSGNQTMEGC